MMKIGCKDLGVGCDFVAEGVDADEVKKKLMDHAMSVHKDKMDMMSQSEKDGMMKKIDAILEKQM